MKKNTAFDLSDYKFCENCVYSTSLKEGEFVLCEKKGLVDAMGECRRFKLDLLSFNPKKLRKINTSFTEEDFKL